MFPTDEIFGFLLISEICIGAIGNSLLFLLYTYASLIRPHLNKPLDLIFIHLTLVNVLAILFKLIPDIASSFGVKHFMGDAGCKAVLYIFRVARGLTLCTTSLLSAFQAITISPSNSKWARLKTKSSTWILPSLFFFWVINAMVYIHVILTLEANRNFTVVGFGYSHPYCQNKHFKTDYPEVFTTVLVTRDVLFVAPVIWTSIYMLNLLHKHRKRAQHLHSPSLSAQPSPENKATHTILWLVSCFVFFYCSNNFVTFYLFFKHQKSPRLERIVGITSSCYPTICPFILMKNTKIISKYTSYFSKLRFTFSSRSIQ
ncbi:vomeronasal type-1 receptor 4-like [Tupaia chinensis]|uniref:vomeronasal type-1 receptor 4-like n=1 Tax=Tupaia chinensis TaxID=246437 RepID=UPI0003C8C524|nr:vomeronasal type-1 receptor 4-like [Tupaia chinensis]